ncbi:MAG: TRL-like family protein [Leptospiraceae bacterium]|nr:TRL-like family protein [Leptospiraceae bacterium]MCP5497395.1 TRL-like family protein [Leptospiraceae bacterium]
MKNLFILLLLIFSLVSCAIGPTSGILLTTNTFPGEFNPANNVRSVKTAEGCQHSILVLFAWGHAGAGYIAYENDIKKISTIDHYTRNVLIGLYRSYCTIVSGE